MDSILDRIKKDEIEAKKAHDWKTSGKLSTLRSAIISRAKNDKNRLPTDDDSLAEVKKSISNVKDVLTILNDHPSEDNSGRVDECRKEIALYEKYLPQQMSKDSLQEVVAGIIAELNCSTPKDMGKVMKELKDRYNGQYDPKMASELVRNSLSG